jgi:ribonuclease P protein component
LLPEERLRRESEYRRCYRQGRRRHGALVSLYFVDNPDSRTRFGFTVGRKVGTAVVRQRLKRRAREIIRRWPKRRLLPAKDIVIHLKPAAAKSEFQDLQQELQRLLNSLMRPRRGGSERGRSSS